MSGEMKDLSGTPRSELEVRAALKAVEQEIVRNPMAKSSDGMPMLFHYLTIRDTLKEALALRELIRIAREQP
jgi:hypothetical protein